MLRYKLAKLVKNRRPGTTAQLPQIHASVAAEAAHLKATRAMLREVHKAVRADLLPVVERELAAQRALVRDVDGSIFERIHLLATALAAGAGRTVGTILRLEALRHTLNFMTTAKRALGVDLSAVVRAEDLDGLLENAATRNVGLIRNLAQTTVARIQTTVTNAVLNGIPAAQLRKRLTADFQFADKRAKVIARDQIAKLNADLNQMRHTQAGITEYVWRTSKDERVRPRHERLDGKVYEYGKPTGAEEGLPPGKPILCRCIAQAIVEF